MEKLKLFRWNDVKQEYVEVKTKTCKVCKKEFELWDVYEDARLDNDLCLQCNLDIILVK